LRTTSNTAARVDLAWNAATDNVAVVSYRLFRNGVAMGGVITGTTYADATVAASTAYTYRVQAVDAAGNAGPLTANLAVTTPAPPDTTAPTVPTKLIGTAGSRRVTLSWTASTDNLRVAGYYVYRATTRVATVTGTTATVTGLTSRTTYTFSVRAFDAAGNISASSTTVSVRAN
jgi:chitodextrinase